MTIEKSLNVSGHLMKTTFREVYGSDTLPGDLYYDGQKIMVRNGTAFLTPSKDCEMISLSPIAEDAINWAIKKMSEEKELEMLAKEYSALQSAIDNLEAMKRLVLAK